MPTPTLTRDILLAALAGFQVDRQRIDAQIAEVQTMLAGGGSPKKGASVSDEAPKKGRRKKFSAAVRKRMAQAQKARWAKIEGDAAPEPMAPEPAKAKRKLSAAGRAAIVKALKERWALKKAAEAAKSAPARKSASKKAAGKKAAVKKAAVKKSAVPVPAEAAV